MRLSPLILLGALACGPTTVRVAGVTVELHTPAEVDPLAGADTLMVRVLDEAGTVVASGSGAPGAGVPIPAVLTFGTLEIEVTGRSNGQVVSAARSGPIEISEGDERTLPLLFLPVNEAVPLQWTPNAHRIGHTALTLDTGEVLLLGGREPGSNVALADSERWSVVSGFAGDGPVLPLGVANASSALLPDGAALVVGGDAGGAASAAVLVISEDGSTVDTLPDLSTPEASPCAATHPSLGGLVLGSTNIELYTALGRVGSAPFDGSGIEACAASGGFVMTAGSDDRWGLLDLRESSWPFDLDGVTTWFPSLPDLAGPQVVALSDGRFWIGGGYGFEASTTTRVVDPSRLEIVESEPLEEGRGEARAAPWRGDRVVLAGGWADAVRTSAVRSVAIHDPDEGPLVSIPVGVREPTLTVLPGGTLLLTGGLDDNSEPAGAVAVQPWVDDG